MAVREELGLSLSPSVLQRDGAEAQSSAAWEHRTCVVPTNAVGKLHDSQNETDWLRDEQGISPDACHHKVLFSMRLVVQRDQQIRRCYGVTTQVSRRSTICQACYLSSAAFPRFQPAEW